MVQRRCR